MANKLKQLEKLACEGDANAMCELGRRLNNGEGVKQDDEQAVHWFRVPPL